ncbi:large ribosomal subunit protein bL31m [Trichomonascus vanleenenianus]|uniref:mitochondrial 54S ribosomal protein bL31m MRPL36 n=1 Tax=Trichomonascus vanleenenianus TaxID=2268995 RepID=UPI003ECB5E1A
MFSSIRPRASAVVPKQVRTVYVPPGGKSILSRRLPRKLKVGETRPPIYYKFDVKVELSDGSVVTRRSQFPKVEWRYLNDQRNSLRWNPTRSDLKSVDSEITGRLAKFQKKYGDIGFEKPKVEEKKEKEVAPVEEAEAEAEKKPTSMFDDYADLMGENVVPVQAGGKLAQKRRGKKK